MNRIRCRDCIHIAGGTNLGYACLSGELGTCTLTGIPFQVNKKHLCSRYSNPTKVAIKMNVEDRKCFDCSSMIYFDHPTGDGCLGNCEISKYMTIRTGVYAKKCRHFRLRHNNELIDTGEDDD